MARRAPCRGDLQLLPIVLAAAVVVGVSATIDTKRVPRGQPAARGLRNHRLRGGDVVTPAPSTPHILGTNGTLTLVPGGRATVAAYGHINDRQGTTFVADLLANKTYHLWTNTYQIRDTVLTIWDASGNTLLSASIPASPRPVVCLLTEIVEPTASHKVTLLARLHRL
jgi:hypothetical protein